MGRTNSLYSEHTEEFTEGLTRKLMGFDVGENNGFDVYPQGIDKKFTDIRECLDMAGGKPKDCPLDIFLTNTKGTAKPEYIITFRDNPDKIIVIECKKTTKFHQSEDLSHPKSYAVDGVLYYAKYLKNNFDVIAIAISGTKEDSYKANSYYWKKGENTFEEIEKTRDIILTPLNYIDLLENKKLTRKFSIEEIKVKASHFNKLMREELQIQPQERISFIASCLLALQDAAFMRVYAELAADNNALIETLIAAVRRVLVSNAIPDNKIAQIINNTNLIKNYARLFELQPLQEGSLFYFLKQLELSIIPMINDANAHQDALGIFYHEFIKYTAGNAGHELGIVLTPEHLCDFMCEIGDIGVNDTVIDICCGTGSFLVSAMKHMIDKAKNTNEIAHIKQKQLYGIEIQANIYTIAITNMIIRGDGQTNIYNMDCFQFKPNSLSNKQPVFTVGLLNPPYAMRNMPELKFVKQLLDFLAPHGVGVVVVPVSCAIGTKFKEERKQLFEHHTLKAVFSMPDDIFYPIGTNVCVMVWIAHVPHNSQEPTFFGYYKDDGFAKRKNLGRVDVNNKWENIKKEWTDLYRRQKEENVKSVLQCVSYDDEWLVEAYMKTDFTKLSEKDFEKTVREFCAFQISSGEI